jgi:hypothetical protein
MDRSTQRGLTTGRMVSRRRCERRHKRPFGGSPRDERNEPNPYSNRSRHHMAADNRHGAYQLSSRWARYWPFLRLQSIQTSAETSLENAFEKGTNERVQALIVLTDAVLYSQRAESWRWPRRTAYQRCNPRGRSDEFASPCGILMRYGTKPIILMTFQMKRCPRICSTLRPSGRRQTHHFPHAGIWLARPCAGRRFAEAHRGRHRC